MKHPINPWVAPRIAGVILSLVLAWIIWTDESSPTMGDRIEHIELMIAIVIAFSADAICCALQRVANATERVAEKPPIQLTGISRNERELS